MFLRVSVLAAAILDATGVAGEMVQCKNIEAREADIQLPDAYVYRGKASFQCKTLQFLFAGCSTGCTKLESNLVA